MVKQRTGGGEGPLPRGMLNGLESSGKALKSSIYPRPR